MTRRPQAQAGGGTWTRPTGRHVRLTVAAILLLVLVGAEASRPFTVLRVQVVDGSGSRRTAAVLPIASGERFEVRFQHSYNHFTIREFFQRMPDANGVVAVEQYVNGDGAGIAEVAGETRFVSAGAGWSRLAGLHRSLDGPLRFRIGMVADHHLVHRCRDVALAAIGAPADLAEIAWDRVGPREYLLARLTLRRADHIGSTCARPGAASAGGSSPAHPRPLPAHPQPIAAQRTRRPTP
ncbi:MAG TPA: DUF1850 domain-containing protein [Euzebya sp.]|nr:DUF1850 domain-containing protein [Euzebya sp.]